MMPLCLRRIYESEAVSVRDLRRSARRTFDREAVHDLRVEIKKLRAFFELVEVCNPLFDSRSQFKPFRKLFKAAAPLREAQVDLSLARDKSEALLLKLDEYRNAMTDIELKARDTFAEAAKSFDPDVLLDREAEIDRTLAGLDMSLLRSKTEEFLRTLTAELLRLKQAAPLDRPALHKIRILGKKTRTILEIDQACFHPDDPRLWSLNGALRAVHQALGEWHDRQLGLTSLRKFYDTQAVRPLRDESSYADYARALQQDRDRRLEAFEKAWKEFARQAAI